MAENNSSAPLKTAGEPFVALGECMADQICQRVAELPDRDSPADWPEAMLFTPDELRNIILDAINDAAQAVAAQAPTGNWINADDVSRLVRDLDIALHGEYGAASQAALCDVVGLVKEAARKLGRPVLAAQAAPAAVAVPDERAAFEKWARWCELDTSYDTEEGCYVSGQSELQWQCWHQRATLSATPALPATEDSSAGDLAEHSSGTALDGGTPGPWRVRKREWDGELLDCFVEAPDCQGLPYSAEILGDDEYREGVARKLADCELIVKAVNAWRAGTAQAEVQAEPVAWIRKTDITELTDSEPESDGWTPLYTAPQAQPADALELAKKFHEVYERLAPNFGYETRSDTKQFDPSSPNGRLMTSVIQEVITALGSDTQVDPIRQLIHKHAALVAENESAYFELCYHRATGWMAWITDRPLCMPPVINPGRKVIAQGQGDTAEEACSDAMAAAQEGGKAANLKRS